MALLPESPFPPHLRAMLPTNPQPRTPQETLEVLTKIIEGLAQRDPNLTITVHRDDKGTTIRLDLP